MTEVDPNVATIAMAAYGTSGHKAPIKPPKLFISGFPKSGLNFADRMAVAMLKPLNPDKNWFGTNAWTSYMHFENLEFAAIALGALKNGEYLKGHLAYLESLEMLMNVLGVGLVFVYRDLRDVVVSQSYHIQSDREDWHFPWREDFSDMTHDEVMLKVITGHGEMGGIFDRWATYAPWMERDWVLKMPFERMKYQQRKAANNFFEYVYQNALRESAVEGAFHNERLRNAIINCIITEMNATHMSVTYRKGKSGGWREEFTPEITAAFKEADKDNWLVRLGYEQDKDW